MRTKTFIAALLLLPLISLFGISAPLLASILSPSKAKPIAVIDETHLLFERLEKQLSLERSTSEHSASEYGASAHGTLERGAGDSSPLRAMLRQSPPHLRLEAVEAGPNRRQQLVQLSDRVRASELFAFVVIEASALSHGQGSLIHYYTDAPNAPEIPAWLEHTVRRELVRYQLEQSGHGRNGADAEHLSLGTEAMFQRVGDEIVQLQAPDPLRDIGIPLGLCMLMYLCVLMSVSPLMHGVLEEKMNRVAEVLVTSVSPYQLFTGKLLGAVLVSYTTLFIYLASVSLLASQLGLPQPLTARNLSTVLVAQGLAVLTFGSLFLAVGSACNDLKESQTLMMPAVGIMSAPLVLIQLVVVDPDGALASLTSLLPLFSPVLMTLRVMMPKGVPIWQILLALGLSAATVGVAMFAASRIFRVGMLVTGGIPSYRKMLRWIISG